MTLNMLIIMVEIEIREETITTEIEPPQEITEIQATKILEEIEPHLAVSETEHLVEILEIEIPHGIPEPLHRILETEPLRMANIMIEEEIGTDFMANTKKVLKIKKMENTTGIEIKLQMAR